MTATVVLVHGAWHQPWCWHLTQERLEQVGVGSVAVDLPGESLNGDATAVGAAIDAANGPVVLVGHSYGGAVITEVGIHPAVRHLVYIAGFPVREDESAWTCGADEAAELDYTGRPDFGEYLVSSDGVTEVSADGARILFYSDVPVGLADTAVARLRPQRMSTLHDRPTTAAWRDQQTTYVVCRADNAVHPGLQRILAQRCDVSVEWETSHSPFLSRPDLVAGTVADLAIATGHLATR
jgi:pimeloyl-ACP methyl ester carboxylesterase